MIWTPTSLIRYGSWQMYHFIHGASISWLHGTMGNVYSSWQMYHFIADTEPPFHGFNKGS